MIRFGAILLSLLLTAPQAAEAQEEGAEEPTILMAVRSDAMPFAHYDAENDSYTGYLVDLCVDAVVRAGYRFDQIPVTPQDRAAIIAGERPEIDLLCDPTTINLARMKALAAMNAPDMLEFSPIVFLANGSFIWNAEAATEEQSPAIRDPNCLYGPEMNTEEGEPLPPWTVRLAGFVADTTGQAAIDTAARKEMIDLPAGQAVCAREVSSHSELIERFCAGELYYYFADLDIIRAYMDRYREERGLEAAEGCPFREPTTPVTYEPYAFIVSARVPGFRQDFVRALYEVFADDTALQRFYGHFGRDLEMSPFLRMLFRINRIPEGAPVVACAQTGSAASAAECGSTKSAGDGGAQLTRSGQP